LSLFVIPAKVGIVRVMVHITGKFGGDKTLAMVARYSHPSGKHIASAMDRLSERVTQELRRA